MLGSTIELTTSSHFIFVFCNIIIVFLLIDRSKRDLYISLANNYPLPITLNVLPNSNEQYAEDVGAMLSTPLIIPEISTAKEDDHECEGANDVKENVTNEQDISVITGISTAKDDHEFEDDNDDKENLANEEDDNDELRKRIEEFINKINREWGAERLRTSC